MALFEASHLSKRFGDQVVLEDIPGHALATSPQIAEIIRKVVEELQPTIVYTHSKNADNQDHRHGRARRAPRFARRRPSRPSP